MKLSVNAVNQAAGGGSFVVIYDAEVALVAGKTVAVDIQSFEPPNADPGLLELARQAIRQGVEQALPHPQGAHIRVHHLLLHPTDFKESRFVFHTAQELKKCLALLHHAGSWRSPANSLNHSRKQMPDGRV